MNIESVRDNLKDYAKDIKLNLGKLFLDEELAKLSKKQVYSIALSCCYSINNKELILAITNESTKILSEDEIYAAKAAATIMAMNNIYYRFIHLVSDKEYMKLPAGLRMNVIANSKVSKLDFELMSLAVSAINGCGMCIDAHVKELSKENINKDTIQATIKISAVINATATALNIN